MVITDSLFVIPARGGSKGLPRKNILPLNGKPLIYYTIDAARGVTSDENICVSTDDMEITRIVESYGLKVPFIRPSDLAVDTAGMHEVLLHALNYYENQYKQKYKKLILLQPTSPLRTAQHIKDAYKIWTDDLDMIVSVKESTANPYYNLFEEENGFLKKSKAYNCTRRQDAPKVWEYNGAIYVIRAEALKEKLIDSFCRVRKYVMQQDVSIDVDNILDFKLLEILLESNRCSEIR